MAQHLHDRADCPFVQSFLNINGSSSTPSVSVMTHWRRNICVFSNVKISSI